jgi:hypothetical protein
MEDQEDTAMDESRERRRSVWPVIALVVALTLLAVWLVPDDEETPTVAPLPRPAEVAQPEPPVAAPAPGEQPAAADAAAAAPAEGDLARAFIARQRAGNAPDLVAAYAEAERLRSEEQLTDAWLIHFYAAREGHAPSALVLGTLSDPTYHEAGLGALDQADPAQALKWYGVAAKAGDTEAARRLANLRTRLEEAAAGGDAEAERLLLQLR